MSLGTLEVDKPERNLDGTYKKGNSGNKLGLTGYRRKVHKVALEHADDAMEIIIHLMRYGSKDDKVRLAAAIYVLEKAFGKFIHEGEQVTVNYMTQEGSNNMVDILQRTIERIGPLDEEEIKGEEGGKEDKEGSSGSEESSSKEEAGKGSENGDKESADPGRTGGVNDIVSGEIS